MKLILPTLAMMTVVLSAGAQERAAGGSLDTQMTWSALSAKIDAANTRVGGLEGRMNQSALCAKQSKLYAPGTVGADNQGCLPVKADFSAANCSMVSLGAPPTRKNVCPAGSTLVATGATGVYGTTGNGSSNAGSVFQGVSTSYGCMKIVCQ